MNDSNNYQLLVDGCAEGFLKYLLWPMLADWSNDCRLLVKSFGKMQTCITVKEGGHFVSIPSINAGERSSFITIGISAIALTHMCTLII